MPRVWWRGQYYDIVLWKKNTSRQYPYWNEFAPQKNPIRTKLSFGKPSLIRSQYRRLDHLEGWKRIQNIDRERPLDRLFKQTHVARGSHSFPQPKGFFFLNQVGHKYYTTGAMRWLSGEELNLEAQQIPVWIDYIHILNNSLSRLSDKKDELIWSFGLGGK